jgi:hypothetical protein
MVSCVAGKLLLLLDLFRVQQCGQLCMRLAEMHVHARDTGLLCCCGRTFQVQVM